MGSGNFPFAGGMGKAAIVVGIAALMAAALPRPAVAQDVVSARLIEAAKKLCTETENGRFDPREAVSAIDLTGDDAPETIVDDSQFTCSSAPSLYCGTGGCGLRVIVGGKPFDFLAKGWKVEKNTEKDARPVLATGVHWSLCNYKSPCVERFRWNGKGFESLGAGVDK